MNYLTSNSKLFWPKIFLIFFMIYGFNFVLSQTRTEVLLDKDWKFLKEDNPEFSTKNWKDATWQNVKIPHDWAIYGPFGIHNDQQHTAILQDGQTQAMEHAGRTGGLPFVGVAWYRKEIQLEKNIQSKKTILQFDGAMSRSQVFVNGQKVGEWPYGYNTFYFDISDFVHSGKNQIAVRLENLPESSRWYPGAGLYRNVHLIISEKTRIAHWGTFVLTEKLEHNSAQIQVQTKIESTEINSDLVLRSEVYNQENVKVADETKVLESGELFCIQNFKINLPELWSVEKPNRYKLISKLYKNGKLIDEYETPFGIRTIEVKPNDGFYLNGVKTEFKGVCLHHDLGPLGAAVNESAIRRQIQIMKDMGANAIRTSHNMPAPELVRLCDEMGMMLMLESFDEWKIPKVKNGYHLYFDQWAEKDLVNLIHHYRNNPSVVMWCIGNEVPEQSSDNGYETAEFLQEICHREDPTRPVTQGMDNPDAVINNGFAAVMEVAGFNYRPFKYQEAYNKLPQKLVLGSETVSTLSSRGVYKFPVERKSMAKYPDHQASSYDVEHCGWSELPEDNFIQQEDLDFTIGEFVWTGFDYLGEPTPYYSDWPSHSSLFGIVDLAGIPKDRYYLYKSHWNTKENTLHVLPHWTWPERLGEITPVFVYTSYPAAELFINGKSQGIKKKELNIDWETTENETSSKNFDRQKRYRLMWMDTVYEPGTIKVIAYDENGNAVEEKQISTASEPKKIRLEADRLVLKSNGKDLAFIKVSVLDEDGNLCPNANIEMNFKVKGAAHFKAVANGDPTSLESFQTPKMRTFNGQLVVIVESDENNGNAMVEVSATGLIPSKIKLKIE